VSGVDEEEETDMTEQPEQLPSEDPREPGRPDHDLPDRPGVAPDPPGRPGAKPDHDLPQKERPTPKR
jgi:hypothetical protein